MPEHTIAENLQRLQTARTAIGSAIIAKGGTVNSGDGLEEFPADIATIPSGGSVSVPSKDVNFYDYDGSIVYSYTADEFAELSALPANPTHSGLTAQGWNWSLSDAKDYVADYGMLNIGQMYVTSDGKTRLYITLTEGRLKPYLGLTGNLSGTTVSIDWGDGSATETVILNTNTVYTPHKYASTGDYMIAINVTSGTISISAKSVQCCLLVKSPTSSNNEDTPYINAINMIEIGNDLTRLNSYSFRNCYSLKTVSFSKYIIVSSAAFQNCSSLKSITAFNISGSLFGTGDFSGCYSLESIVTPNGIASNITRVFQNCYSLRRVTAKAEGNISWSSLQNCFCLENLVIYENITNIDSNAFNGCLSLVFIKFYPTVPPTVANTNAWTGIPSDCYILVPYDTLDDYLNETNMPDDSIYLYLCYAKYADGVSLPTQDSDGYTLTWYATKDDARAGTNPITVGNGKEIYAVGV